MELEKICKYAQYNPSINALCTTHVAALTFVKINILDLMAASSSNKYDIMEQFAKNYVKKQLITCFLIGSLKKRDVMIK